MNKSDLLIEILAELRPLTTLPVDTEGIDGDQSIPRITLGDVTVTRVSDGHQTYVGTTADASGIETGTVHHLIWRASVDAVVLTTDEGERDDVLNMVGETFGLFEDLPHEWHPDVREIEVGAETPRALPFREPDLFSGGRTLVFEYVQELTKDADALAVIQQEIDPTFTISETVQ